MAKVYNQHSIKVANLKPLKDTVIVTDMVFDNRITRSGIILLDDDTKESGIRPRRAKVYAVGPDVDYVRPGQFIYVSHGRWTRGTDIEDAEGNVITIRKVDPKDILAVSDEYIQDDAWGYNKAGG